jgi:hypothetical protein
MPIPPWTSQYQGIEPRFLQGPGTSRGDVSGRRIRKHEGTPAACLPYNARAPEVARTLKEMIQVRLPDVAVEHVGSTAVPGCANFAPSATGCAPTRRCAQRTWGEREIS